MNANFFFFFQGKVVVGGGKFPAKIAKLYFIKDLLAMTEGDC